MLALQQQWFDVIITNEGTSNVIAVQVLLLFIMLVPRSHFRPGGRTPCISGSVHNVAKIDL